MRRTVALATFATLSVPLGGRAIAADDFASWPVAGTELGAAIAAFHTDATAEVK